jgi:two-component system chemotaxis response regulator CheB
MTESEMGNRKSKIRVLVVEDSRTVRALLVYILEEAPAIQVVGEAENGHQAVEMAAALRPDLIMMDVVMPDMDGLEATRRIMAEHPAPILIVTAHADSPELGVAFEALKAGAVDVVAKPIGFDEVEGGGWGQELVAKVRALAGASPRPISDTPT